MQPFLLLHLQLFGASIFKWLASIFSALKVNDIHLTWIVYLATDMTPTH